MHPDAEILGKVLLNHRDGNLLANELFKTFRKLLRKCAGLGSCPLTTRDDVIEELKNNTGGIKSLEELQKRLRSFLNQNANKLILIRDDKDRDDQNKLVDEKTETSKKEA